MLRYIFSKRRVCRVMALSLMCLCIPVGFAAAQGTGAHHHQQEDGTYRFAGLLPGRYGLTAELPGFAINKKQFKFR